MSSENESIPESTPENQADQEPQEAVKPRAKISSQDKKFLQEALTRFISCGRCSLFLAAYRINHDDVELLAAVNNIKEGWLTLSWDQSLRSLINKSYGCRIDVEAYYFESCCPECHSSFIYSEPENDQAPIFRIKM